MHISFVIPAYNEERLIRPCLLSILREINRNHLVGQCEIIVVDNGSTDRTHEQASHLPGVSIVYEIRKGVVHARQTGHQVAQYEYVASIDADSELPTGWLDAVVLAFMHYPHAVAVTGPVFFKDLNIFWRAGVRALYALQTLFHPMLPSLQGGNYVLRKSKLDAVGGYDTTYAFYGEDTQTAVRLATQGRIQLVTDMWVYTSSRRLKGDGILTTAARYIANYFSVHCLGKAVTKSYNDVRP